MNKIIDGRKMKKEKFNNIKIYIDKELKYLKLKDIKEELKAEIKYHIEEYNTTPKKIYILHYLKFINNGIEVNKNIMVITL